jgi:alpha-D-xyloside xylohydrolase
MPVINEKDGRLEVRSGSEKVWIEAWGRSGLRVRATKLAEMPEQAWALESSAPAAGEIKITENGAEIKNGRLTARVTPGGKITFVNSEGRVLLEEFVRNRADIHSPKCSALELAAREWKPILGGDFSTTVRFESDPREKLFGMGQYQQPMLDMKGCELELAQRNSVRRACLSCSRALGYGFLWNNPAMGSVTIRQKSQTSWRSVSTKVPRLLGHRRGYARTRSRKTTPMPFPAKRR